MNSKASLVAKQVRLQEWAADIRDCKARPQGMTIEQWCRQHSITKATYYWRLRAVRNACLDNIKIPETVSASDKNLDFVELPQLPAPQLHRTAIIHIGSATIDLPEDMSDEMLFRIIKAVTYAQ